MAHKLDVSKAYDRVDWGYLKNRMEIMGFDAKCGEMDYVVRNYSFVFNLFQWYVCWANQSEMRVKAG